MDITTFIRRFEKGQATLESLPLPQARKHYDALCQSFTPSDPAGMQVADDVLAHVPIRRFKPAHAGPGAVIFLHGGGFTIGSVVSHHGVAASLAEQLKREVISVDYPLAYEANYSSMLKRCCEVIDAAKPACMVGDSAGARLAMDASIRLNSKAVLGLIYPPVNGLRHETLGPDAPLLSRQDVLFISPLCPALASSAPTPLPKGVVEVLAVEHDPLTAPLERVVEQWRHQGAEVGYRCAPNMVHGALHAQAHLPDMQNAWQDFCQALERRLASKAG
ncbi:alpha/beta hydrolase [Vreelandella sp. TE19]